jgi:CRP-like cAMP-binding protein
MPPADPTAHRNALAIHLRRHPYFSALDPAQVMLLADEAVCRSFAPGEIILLDGMPCTGLWVIGEGQVKVYKLSLEGNEHILHLLGPGNSFNDIAALDGGPNPASAAALTPVEACVLSHDTLQTAILSDPALAQTLIRLLAERTRGLVQQIEDLALYSVRTRVARFLLKQADSAGLPDGNGHGEPLNGAVISGTVITRAAIAAHLATQPETLSRALKSLEKAGIIRVERAEIEVLRADLLRVAAML